MYIVHYFTVINSTDKETSEASKAIYFDCTSSLHPFIFLGGGNSSASAASAASGGSAASSAGPAASVSTYHIFRLSQRETLKTHIGPSPKMLCESKKIHFLINIWTMNINI